VLIEAAAGNRYGHRDAPMVLLAYRHALRAAEIVDLRWEQIDFKTATLHVRRVKNGKPAMHPLTGREMRELRQHHRGSPQSPFVFVSERGAPLSVAGFSRMVERATVEASLGIKAHAHMLRPACSYKLTKDGIDTRALQAYLGHRNIQNTTRYAALAPGRFKGFWPDWCKSDYYWLSIFEGEWIMRISRFAWTLALSLGLVLIPTILIAQQPQRTR
jgi:integrase